MALTFAWIGISNCFRHTKTVVDPTLDELAILGGVVVVRTVLSVFLNKEIKELAENDSAKEI